MASISFDLRTPDIGLDQNFGGGVGISAREEADTTEPMLFK